MLYLYILMNEAISVFINFFIYFIIIIFLSSLAEDKVLAFLYNDEIHSYDEVIQTLTQNVKLQHSDAVALATYVDRKVSTYLSLSLSLSLTPLTHSLFTNYRDEQ